MSTVSKNFVVFLINCIVPSNGVTEKIEGPDKNGRLYDKAGGKVRKIKQEQKEADGEGKSQQARKNNILLDSICIKNYYKGYQPFYHINVVKSIFRFRSKHPFNRDCDSAYDINDVCRPLYMGNIECLFLSVHCACFI